MTPTRLAEIEAHFNGRIPKTLPVRLALEACKIARSLESDLAKANTKIGEQEACYDQHERLESDNARLTRELAETHLRYADIRLGLEKERDAARDELDESRKRLGEAIAIRTRQYKEARAVLEVEQRAGAILAKDAEEARAEAEALMAALAKRQACEYRLANPAFCNTHDRSMRDCWREGEKALTAGAAKAATQSQSGGGEPEPSGLRSPPAAASSEGPKCEHPRERVDMATGFCYACRRFMDTAPPKPEPRAEELVCPDYKHTWEQCPIRKHGFGLWPASQWGK